jgi:Flp pilus assembly protein TadD
MSGPEDNRISADCGYSENFQKGLTLARLGKFEEAQAAYLECIRLQPSEPSAFQNLGFVYYELGRDDDAQEAFHEAARLRALADSSGTMRF